MGTLRKQALPFLVESNDRFTINPEMFSPLRNKDASYTHDIIGQEIKDEKGGKIGKILAQQYNAGVAIIDLPRLYKQKQNALYYINDKKCIIWQPTWLKLYELEQE